MNEDKKCDLVGMLQGGVYDNMHDISRRVYSVGGIAPTIHTSGGGNQEPKVAVIQKPRGKNKGGVVSGDTLPTITKNAFEQNVFIGAFRGRNPDKPTDRTPGLPTEQMLEIRGDGTANALTTVQKDNVVVTLGGGLSEDSPIAYDEQNQYLRKDGCVGTITTDGSSPKHNNRIVERGLRVRKLTSKECWRLMGFTDEDYDKAKWYSKEESEELLKRYPKHKGKRKFSKEQRIERMSNSQLYHQAGNSIVVTVLMAEFGEMFDIDYISKIAEYIAAIIKEE